MTVPRYSLYGTTTQWAGNIQIDAGGRWVRWVDIVPYLEYCEQQKFQPPEQLELPTHHHAVYSMVEEPNISFVNEDDDHELPLDDGEDLYDLMTRYPRQDSND